MSGMKCRIIGMAMLFILLLSFSVYGMNFTPEETFDSVVVVYTDVSVGSGFSVKENMIITNAHVVKDYKSVTVKLYDGTTVRGTVQKTDTEKDLALIEVDRKMVPLEISSDDLKIGQEVYAIGAPKDMTYTMTKGIISALDRKLRNNTYVQIDASVNEGNSGGPLVDENGRAVGVITLKASNAEGIGFAIKAKDVNAFIANEAAANPNDSPESGSSEKLKEPGDSQSGVEDLERQLMTENDGLKVAVCISVVLNMVLGALCLYLLSRRNSRKRKDALEKDEFDFEIEIEGQ